MKIKQRTIDEATARKLAVEANCDPRTVRKALNGNVQSLSALRAVKVLIKAGLLQHEIAA